MAALPGEDMIVNVPNGFVERSISHNSKKGQVRTDLTEGEYPPLDKGYAWVIMAASSVNLLLASGGPNAFGVFQAYYLKVLFVDEPAEKIAWISTMTVTCSFSGGLLAGPLVKIFGMRNASLIGTIIATAGLILASFSTQIWQLVLTQGVIYGLGSSLIMNISLSAPALWFDKYKGFAIGVVASGGSSGALILVPIVTKTVSALNIQWSFRVLAILYFVFTGVSGYLLKPRKELVTDKKLVDFSSLKDPAAVMIYLVGMLLRVGFNVIVLYFPASLIDIGKSPTTSTNLIMVYSVFSSISRIVCGHYAKRLGAVNILIVFHAITGIIFLSMWYSSHRFSVYLAFYIMFGIFGVPFFSLGLLIVADYYPDEKVRQINGMSYLAMGMSILVSLPTTGVIFQKVGKRVDYSSIIILGAAAYFASLVPLILLKRFLKQYNTNFKVKD
ncbi:putative transporter ESBP6 [Smittium mucronatum]|uniref:Putative transporter ESBP6 n=1 Tax=Smittium mucronatum TaxID=133383 RepID=A0A1R0GLJ3_9FUNG|nr:putative transporter ESBP6 [Smittium mucronatum]